MNQTRPANATIEALKLPRLPMVAVGPRRNKRIVWKHRVTPDTFKAVARRELTRILLRDMRWPSTRINRTFMRRVVRLASYVGVDPIAFAAEVQGPIIEQRLVDSLGVPRVTFDYFDEEGNPDGEGLVERADNGDYIGSVFEGVDGTWSAASPEPTEAYPFPVVERGDFDTSEAAARWLLVNSAIPGMGVVA